MISNEILHWKIQRSESIRNIRLPGFRWTKHGSLKKAANIWKSSVREKKVSFVDTKSLTLSLYIYLKESGLSW